MIEFDDIRVPETMDFADISGEVYRKYIYQDGSEFHLEDPIALNVSKSGGHRLILSDGRSIYVRHGWIAFEFKALDDDRAHWRF
jgi:hypothetical protein